MMIKQPPHSLLPAGTPNDTYNNNNNNNNNINVDPLTISTQQIDGNNRTSSSSAGSLPHNAPTHQSNTNSSTIVYQKLERTLAHVRQHLPVDWQPKVAIICGSGLGGLADTLRPIQDSGPHSTAVITLDYCDIPHFPQSTVQGHAGKLVFGRIGKVPTVCMVGRFHFYEGHSLQATTYPVRLFHLLGVKTLLVTNASGSLNHQRHRVGNVMIIKDHINLPGMAGLNPLIGPNLERFGPRFPPTSYAYDPQLRQLAHRAASEVGMAAGMVGEGIYSFVAGPSYETMAESRFLRMAGADAVGMSTVPEVIVAVHCGMRVLGLSLITNLVLMNDNNDNNNNADEAGEVVEPPNHEEVLRTSQLRAKDMQLLVRKIVELILF